MKERAATPTGHPDPRWIHVITRDKAADGQFVYAVVTTGVYCRPGCPARLPKPDNVRFYSTAEEAEQQGFRPCQRCRPHEQALRERQRAQVTRACRLLEASDSAMRLSDLAQTIGLSAHHFHRLFRQTTGLTPRQYAMAHRNRRLREQLEQQAPVTEAVYAAGYGSASRFYASSTEVLGMTPAKYRDGGVREAITFAVSECSLGHILVAQSAQGLCAILLGDDEEALIQNLQIRFPKAELTQGTPVFEQVVTQVVKFVEAPGPDLALPLDIRGTAFQQRVWQALRRVPPGKTLCYTELAEQAGVPGAVRAVAGACAANPLAVAVPCHRVVRKDGSLSGYRWGVERKRQLLNAEKHR